MKRKLIHLTWKVKDFFKKPVIQDSITWLFFVFTVYTVWSFAHWDIRANHWSVAARWVFTIPVSIFAIFLYLTADKK